MSRRAGDLLAELDDLRLPRGIAYQQTGGLPSFILQTYPGRLGESYLPPTVGLPLRRFMSPHGKSFRHARAVIEKWRARGLKRIVLIATSEDRLLEYSWTDRRRFVAEVTAAGIDLVAGPAFSVYIEDQPLDHMVAVAKSCHVFRLLREEGARAIPACGFTTEGEARKLGGWIKEEGIDSVFFDLQLAESSAWPMVFQLLPVFLTAAGDLALIVINGLARPDRILKLRDLLMSHSAAKTSFVGTQPYFMAVKGREYFNHGGKLTPRRSDASREEILRNLAEFYLRLCENGDCRYDPVGRPAA